MLDKCISFVRQEADKQHKEEIEVFHNEKEELWSKLQEMVKQESSLQAKVLWPTAFQYGSA